MGKQLFTDCHGWQARVANKLSGYGPLKFGSITRQLLAVSLHQAGAGAQNLAKLAQRIADDVFANDEVLIMQCCLIIPEENGLADALIAEGFYNSFLIGSDRILICQCPFSRIQQEVKESRLRRLIDARDATDSSIEAKFSDLLTVLEEGAKSDIELVWSLIGRVEYSHPGLTRAAYLMHPLRIAKSLTDWCDVANKQSVALALAHNLIEVGLKSSGPVIKELGLMNEHLPYQIKTLTVDRKLQSDRAYIDGYYSAIREAGATVARVKVLDKLDNLYLIVTNPDDDVRSAYLTEIEKFVMPLARQFLPGCVPLISYLIITSRRTGYLSPESILSTEEASWT